MALRLPALLTFLGRRPKPSGGALIPALDALRGVAVLSVFFQHLGDTHLPFVRARVAEGLPPALGPWVMTVLHHAHWGVDLFFVLSGFSLAQPILARAYRASASATSVSRGAESGALVSRGAESGLDPLAFAVWGRAFFRRRFARIYPGYLAALALVIATVPPVRHHPSFGPSLIAHLTMLQGYWLPGGLAIIGAAWSLTTEASFYLLWPLLAPRVLSGPKAAPRALAPTPAASRARQWLTAFALVVLVWLVRALLHDIALRPTSPAWLLEASQRRWAVSRLDQFLLGALGASLHARLLRSRHHATLVRLAPALVVLAAIALVPAFYLEGACYPEPLGSWPYALVSLATATLVFASASVSERVARWLFPLPLRWVGVVSYGVFLHHQLALGATARLAGSPGTWPVLATHAALALGLSLLLGWLSWVAVERPAIDLAAQGR